MMPPNSGPPSSDPKSKTLTHGKQRIDEKMNITERNKYQRIAVLFISIQNPLHRYKLNVSYMMGSVLYPQVQI